MQSLTFPGLLVLAGTLVPGGAGAQDPLPPLNEYQLRTFTVADGLAASDVVAVAQAGDGYLYVAGGHGVMRFNGYGFEVVPVEGFATRFVERLHVDEAGRLGVVTRRGEWGVLVNGVVRPGARPADRALPPTETEAPSRSEQPIAVEGPRVTPDVGPRHVLTAPDGTRWFADWEPVAGTARLRWQRQGRSGEVLMDEELQVRDLNQIVADHEGSVWVGTDRGLVQISPRRVAGFTAEDGLRSGFTTGILQSRNGAVWVGTWGGGLHRFQGGRLTAHYTTETGLPDARVRSLFQSGDGTIWVGTWRGIATLRPAADGSAPAVGRTWTARSVRSGARPHPDRGRSRAFAETTDSDGVPRMWAAWGPRLVTARRPAGGWTEAEFVPYPPDLDLGREIWALHVDSGGALWAGGTGGLVRIDSDSVRRFGPGDGLRGEHVSSLHPGRDGAVWVGTYGDGLHRYRDGRFVAVTLRDGLHRDGVWEMLDDGRGFAWMSSDGGIFRVSWERLEAVADALERGRPPERRLEPLVFREAEGMPSRESNRASPGGWRLTDGRLIFNSVEGIVVIDPEQAVRSPPAPPTRLQGVVVDGNQVEGPRLSAGTRHIVFEYAALSFAAPKQNRYRYRLEGYDDDWVDGGTRRHATYTHLPAGRYTFRVQGAAGAGPWSRDEARYAFVIPPFFWQTWWFRGGLAVAVLGLVATAYQVRVRHLLERQRLRLQIASDLHDDVGSNLSSIALLSQLLESRDRFGERERRQLRRIHDAANETLHALRDIIWLVDPKYDSVGDLVERMRKVGDDLLNGTPHELRAPPERLLDETLSMSVMRNVFLVYKEALHNAARHAPGRPVRAEIDITDARLRVRIQDDGPGLSGAMDGNGYGLANMRRRAEAANGTLAVESAPGTGTTVTLDIPIA